jgi:uncharacterized protein
MAHGVFLWNELQTRDPDEACRFYGATLGWTFDKRPRAGGDGFYIVAKSHGKAVAGIVDITSFKSDAVPPQWFSYVSVYNVDSAYATAIESGAHPLREPYDIPGIGRVAILADPTGALIGFWSPAPHNP